ncbi:DNA-binding Lrp family transcriptional regulator [Rubricella aquisinus]|uniref:DNA-binding Lrp family transcriptional regulator n=1 Tax=Rubricella aquisinus TaxID=2028108 RepID=A0A840WMZ2_9RHOB|nr:DNA-binding Lrp family transcriptional regulator [Rubricella aquisinus]
MKTENIPSNRARHPALDGFDRKILGALVADAGQSYAQLGAQVGLSAPAVHERVKRLRAAGHIRGTHANISPEAAGKPLLAFVHVDTVGWGKSAALMAMARHPEIEEIHSVAGDTCMLLKVRTAGSDALEHLLAQLYALDEVTATRSYIALTSYLERPVQAEVTEDWPKPYG